ncbi:MAG: hypothetical protein NT070_00035, partial [Cyanobacteria bacterium]|nr:hypothetical protein [Cyanobacteriota bacterium]
NTRWGVCPVWWVYFNSVDLRCLNHNFKSNLKNWSETLILRYPLEGLQIYGCKCFIYLKEMSDRELQIDHRIPFEIDGEPALKPENFMLLCASANRAKSWSCEHCENRNNLKDKLICLSCYWAYPDDYTHIAMRQIRRVDLIWEGENTEIYENLKQRSIDIGKEIPEFIKEIIERELGKIPTTDLATPTESPTKSPEPTYAPNSTA